MASRKGVSQSNDSTALGLPNPNISIIEEQGEFPAFPNLLIGGQSRPLVDLPAIKAALLLIAVSTRDTVNFSEVLFHITGKTRKPKIWSPGTAVKIEAKSIYFWICPKGWMQRLPLEGLYEFQSPPTRNDALAALKFLSDVFSGFPFVTDLDRAIAIAACLAVVMAPVLDTKPGIGISGTAPGSGKGYLIRMVVVLATGRLVSPMSMGTEEELIKHLDAKLLRGDSIVAIDNISRPLGGDRLCTLVSEPISPARPLCTSLSVDVPSPQLFVNGNGLTVIGDMCRRVLILTLDPKVERPELREFEFNALAEIYRQRPKYLRAVLTILLAHRHADPAAGRKYWPPLGSFERWSRVVRDPLMWLGLPNVVDALEKNRANDPSLQKRVAVLTAITDVIAFGAKFSTTELISLAIRQHEAAVAGTPPAGGPLREALLGAVGHGGGLEAQSVGTYLGKICDRITEGRVLRKSVLHGSSVWRIEKLDGAPVAQT